MQAGDIEKGLEEMKLPTGYFAEVSGEYEERQESDRRLLGVGLLAAVGIFFLLLTSFGSARLRSTRRACCALCGELRTRSGGG